MPIDMTKLDRFPRQILVLAPHPDDFDAIGMTMKYFHDRGCDIHLAIVSTGVSGVDDDFCNLPTIEQKRTIRQAEQLASCRFFGLPQDQIVFLNLDEDETHHPVSSAKNLAAIKFQFLQIKPDTVFLPHGNDKNATHRLTFTFFEQVTQVVDFPITAYLSRDPKTIRMRHDMYLPFDESEAEWKAELLRQHRSQQERNLKSRGFGFDERILRTNRQIAAELQIESPYAEVFEIRHFNERTTS